MAPAAPRGFSATPGRRPLYREQATENEGGAFSDRAIRELARAISAIADRSPRDEGHDYDYAPRKRYHLLELSKFSGKVEEYPLFRQNLQLCLERERFRDKKDEALFVYKHLEGQARDLVTHFMTPLSNESCAAVLARLERTYGREHDVDRLLIRKIYRLPKLTDLTYDSLVHMVTVIEAAIPALRRREPGELETVDGDRLSRLLGLLPPTDADLFYMHCLSGGLRPNLLSLVDYLTFRCQARKARLPLPSDRVTTIRTQRPRTKVLCAHTYEETEHQSSDNDNGTPVFAVQSNTREKRPSVRPPCSLCEDARHDLGYCPKFKLLNLDDKRKAVDTAKACSSCLNAGHFIKDCKRRKRCIHKGCTRSHHPLLHDDYQMRINFFDEVGGDYPSPAPSDSEDSQ
jgi:hypothetical protein